MTRAPGLEAAHVRAASSADWPAIAALLTASRLPVVGAEAHVADFLVAEADGRLVGAVGLERYAEGALLRSAVVDADWRGRGMGELLVRRCIARAEALGIPAVYLLTETAQDFFPRFGFLRITRADVPAGVQASVEFRGACPDSAIVMKRVVTPAA